MAPLKELLRWIGPRTVVAVLALVGLELGLYHFGDYGKWIVQEQSARYGWRMLPDQHGWSRNYDVREQTNDRGFRDDRDWGEPSGDPARLRLAVVGNSMTYGTSVPVEATWPRVLEGLIAAELERRGDGREVQVLNFATQGYTLEQMARLWDDEIRLWEPDILVWPTIAADTRPMRPAVDDVDYGFRRQVIRTATYDMLRERVIDRWLPPPGRDAPPKRARDIKREFREALLPAVRGAVAELLGADPDRARSVADELDQSLQRAFERSTPDRLVRAVWTEFNRPELLAAAGQVDLPGHLWTALEGSLTHELWEGLDSTHKRTPFAPTQQFLWSPRGSRLAGIAGDLAEAGGRLAVVLLPSMHLTITPTATSPAVYWLPWSEEPSIRALGNVNVLDAVGVFRAPMADLAEVLRTRGFDRGPSGEDVIGPDSPHVDQSLFLLDDTGHYNVAGHAVLAEAIFRHLAENVGFGEAAGPGMSQN